ncbi:hypothetical protein A1OQ_22135 [Enterovibrio norvegicus FF-162]|uniref:Uncharacterized protein n=2 Tax=Enterovibrio norvegicus TaxID=188144 RepID=A0A1E5C6W1_9GAMM|nr:hypothetical protein A1OK_21195 [Enterovibrio norvegicus FF-454]OEE77040.1 hypothetical protein A1OQ_22135 [Enterovibrio norvegicus FF-162]
MFYEALFMRKNTYIGIVVGVSSFQAYLSYLLHSDQIQVVALQWVISVFYMPLYTVLLILSGGIESISGWNIGPTGMGYLQNEIWFLGAIILIPVNYILSKWCYRLISRKSS